MTLHHKNGDRTDFQLENLELLCLNCHGQTSTFCGRGNTGKIKVTNEELIQSIQKSTSATKALSNVGLCFNTTNYKRIWKLIRENNLEFNKE